MAELQNDEPLLSSKKYRYIVLGCLLGLLLFYFTRSCTVDTFSEHNYIIGQDNRWIGIDLMGKERNLSAFNGELLLDVAKREKFRVRVVNSPASDLMTDVEQGRVQGMLTALQPSYLTENRLLFSDPYFLVGPVLIIPSTAPLQGWNEKRKKIVGILPHSSVLLILEQDPTIQIKLYDDILHALADLSDRHIDGAIIPVIPAYTYVKTFYKHELKIATLPLTDEGIRLATLKNEAGQELIKRFQEGIASMKKDGSYKALLDQWGLVDVDTIQSK